MKNKKLMSIILIGSLLFSTAVAYGQSVLYSKYGGANYTHATKFDNSLILDGIDVSQWNQTIDWNKVKADGIDYVIIRIAGRGYGDSGRLYFDDNANDYIKGAKEAGLLIGGYYFSQAITEAEAIEEANHTKEILDRYNLAADDFDLPIFMDREFMSDEDGPGRLNKANLTKDAETKIEKAFCDRLRELGFDSGLYANLLYLNNNTNGDSLVDSGYTVWEAQYNDVCDYAGKYSLWQYTSSGRVSGISTNTDCNFWYLNKGLEGTEDTNNFIENCFVEVQEVLALGAGAYTTEMTVKHGNATLVEGTDYEIIYYINNDSIGTAYAIVRGIGQYTGYRAVPYEIVLSGNLNSETYTIGEFVTGVALDTPSSDFLSKFTVDDGYSLKLLDKDSHELLSSTIGTGMKLAIYDTNSNPVGKIDIVVKGDATGDGLQKNNDLTRLRKQLLPGGTLSGAYYESLDLNGNGRIDNVDLTRMRKALLNNN